MSKLVNPVGSNISYSRLIKTVSNTNKFNVCQRVFDALIALGGVGSDGGGNGDDDGWNGQVAKVNG